MLRDLPYRILLSPNLRFGVCQEYLSIFVSSATSTSRAKGSRTAMSGLFGTYTSIQELHGYAMNSRGVRIT
eukprot:COSAG05_NODE_966_length_6399_cov_8.790476_1_plen_70_part_10